MVKQRLFTVDITSSKSSYSRILMERKNFSLIFIALFKYIFIDISGCLKKSQLLVNNVDNFVFVFFFTQSGMSECMNVFPIERDAIS